MTNHGHMPGCLWNHRVWGGPCVLSGASGRSIFKLWATGPVLQMRQDFKLHPKRDFPVGVEHSLSSPPGNEDLLKPGEEGRWSGGQGGFSAGLCSEILVSCWPIKRQLIFSLVKCPWKQILFPPNQFPLLAYANGALNESRVCFLHSRVRTFKWDPGGELSFLCLHEQHGSQGGNNSVKFYCQNSKEGKLTGGAGNLCFASCCLPDSCSV